MMLKRASLLAMVSMLYGCIVVDDFGGYWEKGYVDSCVNAIVTAGMNADDQEVDESPEELAMRSLTINHHSFLMIRDHPQEKGGNLIRYAIHGDRYVSYRLNDAKRDAFRHDYPESSIVLTSETATIPVLDERSAALLGTIADDDSYWLENDNAPYNPDRRPDCIRQAD